MEALIEITFRRHVDQVDDIIVEKHVIIIPHKQLKKLDWVVQRHQKFGIELDITDDKTLIMRKKSV